MCCSLLVYIEHRKASMTGASFVLIISSKNNRIETSVHIVAAVSHCTNIHRRACPWGKPKESVLLHNHKTHGLLIQYGVHDE